MATPERLICTSDMLAEGGRGVRFEVEVAGEQQPAFAVRYNGMVHAYLNRCAHIGVELDFNEGDFFEDGRLYLMCSTHGALYDPETGACIGGPCAGKGLYKLPVCESERAVYIILETPVDRL